MRRAAFSLALVLALATPASAQERLTLRWEAPAECPDAAALREEVERLLGGEIPTGDPVEAEGATEPFEEGFRLTLRTRMGDAPGERVLEGDRCEELADAAAVILALMIDPEAVIAPPETSAEPVVEAPVIASESVAEPPRTVEVRRELSSPVLPTGVRGTEPGGLAEPERPRDREAHTEPDAERSVRAEDPADDRSPEEPDGPRAPETPGGLLGVGGGVDVGTVPAPSTWLWIEGGYGGPLIDGRLRAGAVLPQRALRDTASGADIYSLSLDARACVHPFEDLRGLYGCGGLILGISIAEGFGFDAPETGIGTFLGAVLGITGEWRPVDWLGLGLDATLVIPFNPLEFAARGAEPFHVQSDVSGRFSLQASLHF